jgi:DNA-binding LacI/PurR family transcriptional regulator
VSTIRDVARLAGVSVTTAHRGMTGKSELRSDTRERILQAAQTLNYVPSAAARSLVTGRSNTIGMVVTDNASPVYAGIVRGVEEVLNGGGYGLLLCNSSDNQERSLASLELLRSKQVDGVLLAPVQSDRRDLEYLLDADVPFVLLLRHFLDRDDAFIAMDNEAAGRLVTEHLLGLGHRRIGHIAGPSHVSSAQGRLSGYRLALEDAGVLSSRHLVTHVPFTIEGGFQAAVKLLELAEPPTAIFAANDVQAVGVLKAARQLGVAIPKDLALAGGDDIELAKFLLVPLTTFRQPSFEIGRLAAGLLLSRMRGEQVERTQVVLQPELIVRDSSGEAL